MRVRRNLFSTQRGLEAFRKSVFTSQRGISLISVLVGMGLVALLAVAVNRMMSLGMKAQFKVNLDMDRIAIGRHLMARVSCTDSYIVGSTCASPGPKPMYDSNGDIIIPNTGSGKKFGKFTVKAECNEAGDGLIIKAARLKAGAGLTSTSPSDFLPDPLTGRIITWNDVASKLYPDGVDICPVSVSERSSRFAPSQPFSAFTGSSVSVTVPAGKELVLTHIGNDDRRGCGVDGIAYYCPHCNFDFGQAVPFAVTLSPGTYTFQSYGSSQCHFIGKLVDTGASTAPPGIPFGTMVNSGSTTFQVPDGKRWILYVIQSSDFDGDCAIDGIKMFVRRMVDGHKADEPLVLGSGAYTLSSTSGRCYFSGTLADM